MTAAWPRAAGFAGVSGTCKTTACPPPRLALGGAFTAPMPTQPRRRSTASRAVKSADGAVAEQNGADADSLRQLADVTSAVDAALGTILSESAEGAQAPVTVPTSELRAKVEVAIERLSTGLLERETEVRLLLLSALCGEHLLLLGPPGTAKSELSRRLNRLVGGEYFERLLTRFSVPEELFGPLSMRGLENDEYVRQTAGYLPTAQVAFIDEIFKANSAILNALLTLLNERLFDNGNQRLEAPLMTLVGASNELPESEELDALYDRFLIRRTVAQVSNAQLSKLARLAAGRSDGPTAASTADGTSSFAEEKGSAHHISVDEFQSTPSKAYAAVDVPDAVIDVIVAVRNYLQDKCEPPIYVSDRRFMKSIQMLQVAAYGDGRDEVIEADCLLLEHVFGNRPDDCHKVKAYVIETIASDPGLQQAEMVFLGLFGRALRLLGSNSNASQAELQEAVVEAGSLAGLLRSRHGSLVRTLEAGFPELQGSVWLSESAVAAAVQGLSPQMTENRRKVEELLREALVLQSCLERGAAAGGAAGGSNGQLMERMLPKRLKQYQKGIANASAAAPSG
uniref:AAA+ ATPase domain-containing protein n=1 Tax=Chlamydomonas euryale TaxID=1486919 RepID=A0A7R9V9M6_9CHLO